MRYVTLNIRKLGKRCHDGDTYLMHTQNKTSLPNIRIAKT